ncbi:MAG: hypothetical protein R3Y43_07925 [Alphaproteobacteria bacterium]
MEIDNLKEKLQSLYKEKSQFKFNTPIYKDFHDSLTEFIYENNLDETSEWQEISKNLLYKSSQYMTTQEADIISYNLEKIKRILLKKKNETFWSFVHPIIKDLIFHKFYNQCYADCVETAFKEINARLKKFIEIIKVRKKMELT